MSTPKLREHLARLYPGYRVEALEPLAPDSGATSDSSAKAAGYGLPIKITLVCDHGDPIQLVWRVASSNEFGHDRRADRAASMVLAYDDFARIPRHIEAIDLGAIDSNGDLVSIRDGNEVYLITTYAPGTIYAEDLRRIARRGFSTELDRARVDALAQYLAALHATPLDGTNSLAYRRSIRDLVGHGEGIFGIIDGYPPIAGAAASRLRSIEEKCVEWRWRLRDHEGRLARTHGDFHPFNIVFEADTRFRVLDASRGTCGDPADDVTALSINFLLFSLESSTAWQGLGPLWHRFWSGYLRARPDRVLASVAPPFFAWRALVVCNPRFYPSMTADGRDKLLGLAECALETHHLDPAWADELFRCAA